MSSLQGEEIVGGSSYTVTSDLYQLRSSAVGGNNADVTNLQITTNNAGPLAGTTPPTKVLPVTSLRHVREDIVNAYAHFFSAACQRELGRGSVLSVEYSGSRGESL